MTDHEHPEGFSCGCAYAERLEKEIASLREQLEAARELVKGGWQAINEDRAEVEKLRQFGVDVHDALDGREGRPYPDEAAVRIRALRAEVEKLRAALDTLQAAAGPCQDVAEQAGAITKAAALREARIGARELIRRAALASTPEEPEK